MQQKHNSGPVDISNSLQTDSGSRAAAGLHTAWACQLGVPQEPCLSGVLTHGARCAVREPGSADMPSPPRRDTRERELLSAYGQLGDANEVLNERAVAVMKRMSDKLTGRDFLQVSFRRPLSATEPIQTSNGEGYPDVLKQWGLEQSNSGHDYCTISLTVSRLCVACLLMSAVLSEVLRPRAQIGSAVCAGRSAGK